MWEKPVHRDVSTRLETPLLLIANNDWQDDPVQAVEITPAGLAPANNENFSRLNFREYHE
jgi:hypothetical protein